MIFNPYDIHFITSESARTASLLSWAKPQLQDNRLLVGLILGFVLVDLLSFCRRGVMSYQFSWLTDTRSVRTFESTAVHFPWIKPLLLIQVFLFFGLSIYTIVDPSPAANLLHLNSVTWGHLALSIGMLLGWFLLQSGIINWLCFLFGIREKRIIMNRSHKAIYAVLAPFALSVFVLLMASLISVDMAIILLATLFILSQIGFIFSGIKIFYDGLGSLCLIIVYLCTLEIAPLWLIWARFYTMQA